MFENQSWYQSTRGPEISQTIFNIAGSLLPVLSMVFGVQIGPEVISSIIHSAIFLYFSVRAGMGYVKGKRALGAEIERLKGENEQLAGKKTGDPAPPATQTAQGV